MNEEHTCGGRLKAALTCPACLSRRAIEAPKPKHFRRIIGAAEGQGTIPGTLKPYTDDPTRDRDGLKQPTPLKNKPRSKR